MKGQLKYLHINNNQFLPCLGKTQNPNYLLTFLGYKEMMRKEYGRKEGKRYYDRRMEGWGKGMKIGQTYKQDWETIGHKRKKN
jgi:hypothetical protein